jgi:hypothetical protein
MVMSAVCATRTDEHVWVGSQKAIGWVFYFVVLLTSRRKAVNEHLSNYASSSKIRQRDNYNIYFQTEPKSSLRGHTAHGALSRDF